MSRKEACQHFLGLATFGNPGCNWHPPILHFCTPCPCPCSGTPVGCGRAPGKCSTAGPCRWLRRSRAWSRRRRGPLPRARRVVNASHRVLGLGHGVDELEDDPVGCSEVAPMPWCMAGCVGEALGRGSPRLVTVWGVRSIGGVETATEGVRKELRQEASWCGFVPIAWLCNFPEEMWSRTMTFAETSVTPNPWVCMTRQGPPILNAWTAKPQNKMARRIVEPTLANVTPSSQGTDVQY